ncbi:putative fatty acyl-CoA reductase CG5065 [Stomoxys calcitrans]|uniref:putative fatty acyl-CoA reductase CG5065 n=1 Tax=Stomoxys calcitrans TaxID=35570 RepID=UPI0027E34228|nr:putative fatty acyl-CoA reductase CG5065 [Stomoxys calcitrans]
MSLVNFYKDQDIFITGGSGFIGKVLLEKIVRSLPNVGKIYVLLRNKKNKNAQERLNEILAIPLFRRVRREQPESLKKIIAIDGDCQELKLGISSANLEMLRNVSIIFHVAATVRFDDNLRTSILLNTRGTHELVKIAEGLANLKIFMHVSTTYAHPDLNVLEEKIYPPYADWRTTIKLAETYDIETLNILFPKYAPKHPNTYTFTKSLGEHIIEESRHKIPVAILRPSIVVSSFEEPFPGWIDNFNGPAALLVACGAGVLRTHCCNPDAIHDFVPVDMCAKSLIVSAFSAAQHATNQAVDTDEVPVFNCCSSDKRYLTTNDIVCLGKELVIENPLEKCIWLPEGGITQFPVWHYFRFITLQIIPSILLDCLIRLAQHPPVLLRLQRRIVSNAQVLDVFLNNEWAFDNKKLKSLETLLINKEWSDFKFMDFCDADHIEYYKNALKGGKEFLLKENPEASPGARLRMRIFQVVHYYLQFMGTFYLVRYLLGSMVSRIN